MMVILEDFIKFFNRCDGVDFVSFERALHDVGEVVEVEEIAGESGEPISEVVGIGVSLECLRRNMIGVYSEG